MEAARRIVDRRFELETGGSARPAEVLADEDGIVSIAPCRNGIRVRYDAFCWDYEALEAKFERAGLRVRCSWWRKVKVALFGFTDRNARQHLRSRGGACCSRPLGIYGERRKL